jgi:hexokinase
MSEMREVDLFLTKHAMHSEQVDAVEVMKTFKNDIQAGLMGESSSLMMIPTYIELPSQLPQGEKVLVMDAGGTNLRSALVHLDEEYCPIIDHFTKVTMPGTQGEVSKEQFYTILAQQLVPIADQSTRLGFCFSYPTQSTPECDGKVLVFSKEIQAPEVVGSYVGRELLIHLEALTAPKVKQAVVLNDTVATLLMGVLSAQTQVFDGFIGFILGTGTNTAYLEQNSNIKKLQNMANGSQIINIESGAFTGLKQGTYDRELDAKSKNPSTFFLEKMISGAYFGLLCVATWQGVAKEGLLSATLTTALNEQEASWGTKEICDFYNEPAGEQHVVGKFIKKYGAGDDALVMQHIVNNLVQRMVKIIAINLAAVVLQSGCGKKADRPVGITVDGTTFYAFNGLQKQVKDVMLKILKGADQRFFTFLRVDNASLLGAAVAAFSK